MKYSKPDYLVCGEIESVDEIVTPGFMVVLAVIAIAGLVVKTAGCSPEPEAPPAEEPP